MRRRAGVATLVGVAAWILACGGAGVADGPALPGDDAVVEPPPAPPEPVHPPEAVPEGEAWTPGRPDGTPADFPLEIPLPKGGTVDYSDRRATKLGSDWTLSFHVQGTPDQVAAFYRANHADYKIVTDRVTDGKLLLAFGNGKRTLAITGTPLDPETTMVALVLSWNVLALEEEAKKRK